MEKQPTKLLPRKPAPRKPNEDSFANLASYDRVIDCVEYMQKNREGFRLIRGCNMRRAI